MTESPRESMPARRETETCSFEHEGVSFTASSGRFSDGRLSELFMSAGLPGSAVNIMSNEASVIFSVALQHGTPLKILRDALPKLKNGAPAGPLGQAIKLAEEKPKHAAKS